jgi:hypothetical protein
MMRKSIQMSCKAFRFQPAQSFPVRQFSADKLGIPTDAEQQGGRRKIEVDAEAVGEVGFNRDPIIPHADAGTKENPILVNFMIFFCLANLKFCSSNSKFLCYDYARTLFSRFKIALVYFNHFN